MRKFKTVNVNNDEIACVEHVMNLLGRMPYNDLIDLCGIIKADSFHVSEAVREYFTPEPPTENAP